MEVIKKGSKTPPKKGSKTPPKKGSETPPKKGGKKWDKGKELVKKVIPILSPLGSLTASLISFITRVAAQGLMWLGSTL